jgi:hypothetical protein
MYFVLYAILLLLYSSTSRWFHSFFELFLKIPFSVFDIHSSFRPFHWYRLELFLKTPVIFGCCRWFVGWNGNFHIPLVTIPLNNNHTMVYQQYCKSNIFFWQIIILLFTFKSSVQVITMWFCEASSDWIFLIRHSGWRDVAWGFHYLQKLGATTSTLAFGLDFNRKIIF